MFEFSVALKYLIPRWRQLSVSIISLISVLVIALVVWLIVVFFSVSHGLEKSWIHKLIALAAPVRIVPTEDYYRSYYYLIDNISAQSNYAPKGIGQKLLADASDPYNPEIDQEIPEDWPASDHDVNGQLKDIVKLAFSAVQNVSGIKGLQAKEYEMTGANIQLSKWQIDSGLEEVTVSQSTFISSYDPTNDLLQRAIMPPKDNLEPKQKKSLAKFLLDGKDTIPSQLPQDDILGEGILVPKGFQAAGVKQGDRGYISYYFPTAGSMQEHKIPVVVSAIYDPGLLPMAGKVVIANPSIASMIRSAYQQENQAGSNGINVRFADLNDAENVKDQLQAAFEKAGIDKYWKIETFREFEYSRDLLQQLRSEKNLFRLIAAIIILVACSNIVSMLIILVNDKKLEIGILRSMGASSKSIAFIFGFCGIIMGMLGSALGIIAALFTLQNLNLLIGLISRMQGFDVFNPMFYGENLPNEVSFEALGFVLAAAVITSLIAGIVPAIKACTLHPSQILRSE